MSADPTDPANWRKEPSPVAVLADAIASEVIGVSEEIAAAMLVQSLAVLTSVNGRAETAKMLRDLAVRIENPEPHGRA